MAHHKSRSATIIYILALPNQFVLVLPVICVKIQILVNVHDATILSPSGQNVGNRDRPRHRNRICIIIMHVIMKTRAIT